jgi:hypothetical protein
MKVKATVELLKQDAEWFKNVCDQAHKDGSSPSEVLASYAVTDIGTLKYMIEAIDRIIAENTAMKGAMLKRVDNMIVQLNDLM